MTTSKKWRPAIVTVTAGAALALVGCKSQGPHSETHTHNPPMPMPTHTATATASVEVPTSNPPAIPTWDDVESGHPMNATNPPGPVLQLTTDGRCHKQWHAAMVPSGKGTKVMDIGGKSYQVRILTKTDDQFGHVTEIQCPEGAAKVIADNKDKAITPEPRKL